MEKGRQADVLVVGAGIFGLSCAYACTRRGLRVTVVDAAARGAGASGGPLGAMSPHLPEKWTPRKQFQFDALLSAEAHWQAVEAIGGTSAGYARIGRLVPLASEAARGRALARAASARKLWGARALWRVVEGDHCPGWLSPRVACAGAIQETLSARIDPMRALDALFCAVMAAGGTIQGNRRALAVEEGAVRFADGWTRAGAVIVAAGLGGFDLMADALGAPLGQGLRGQAARLGGAAPAGMPMLYADGVYVVPHADGTVGVGATSEADWSGACDTDDRLDAVIAQARQLCPALAKAEVLMRWAGVRPRAPRPDPMLGRLPGLDRVFVANGGFKIGFGIAHAVGEALADMVTEVPVALPAGFAVADHLDAAASNLRR